MFNNVCIMSRATAENFTNYTKNIAIKYAIISISNYNELPANFYISDNIVDILRLKFDDITKLYDNLIFKDNILISNKHCEDIKLFIENNKNNVKFFIVHCQAGISRSSAVAFAIRIKYLYYNPYKLFCIPEYSPNHLVFKKCIKVFNCKISNNVVNKLLTLNSNISMLGYD